MNLIKPVFGYTVAVLSIFVALATFMGNTYFGKALIAKTGLTISPLITGGDVSRTIDHGNYKTDIHQTVFQGLFSERDEGFVQIDWGKKEKIPEMLVEDIDFDNDKKTDFNVEYNTKTRKIKIMPYNSNVIPHGEIFEREDSYTVRVRLKNPKL